MFWVGIGFGLLVLLVFSAVLLMGSRSRSAARKHLRQALASTGPVACEQACHSLEAAAASGSAIVVAVWSELEGPLLQALPDCPPSLKSRLGEALEACHAACRHRQTQRSLMDLRRGL